MATQEQGLFGISPQQLMQNREEDAYARNVAAVKMTPMEQSNLMLRQAGTQAGQLGASLLGIEDPQMQAAKEAQALAGQFDLTSSAGLKDLTLALQERAKQTGNQALASLIPQAAAAYQRAQLNEANVSQKTGENINAMIASGKYTPASLGKYQKTRNAADLELAEKGLTGANKEKVAAAIEANTMIDSGTAEIANYRDMLKQGEVQYGPLTNLTAKASALVGSPTDNATKQQEIESFLTGQINEVLNNAKGVQAKDDALRAERQIKGYLAQNSNAGMDKALELLQKTKGNVKKGNEAYIKSLTGEEPSKPTAPTIPNAGIYNTIRSKPGWEDASQEEIDAAIKSGKIKTGKL